MIVAEMVSVGVVVLIREVDRVAVEVMEEDESTWENGVGQSEFFGLGEVLFFDYYFALL